MSTKSEKKRVVVEDSDDESEVVETKKKSVKGKKKSVKGEKKLTKKEKIYAKVKTMIFEFAQDDPSDESWSELLPKLKKEFKKAELKDVKKKKDPKAPKRVANVYIQFGKVMRPKLKKKFPDMKPKEIVKEISNQWADIKDTKKAEKYKQMVDEDKKRYDKEMKSYTPTPGFEKKEKVRKRATSAYQFWCKDERSKMEKKFPDLKYTELRKKMGEKWKKLSEEKKEPYLEKANKEKIKFKKMSAKKEEESESSEEESEESEESESDDE